MLFYKVSKSGKIHCFSTGKQKKDVKARFRFTKQRKHIKCGSVFWGDLVEVESQNVFQVLYCLVKEG